MEAGLVLGNRGITGHYSRRREEGGGEKYIKDAELSKSVLEHFTSNDFLEDDRARTCSQSSLLVLSCTSHPTSSVAAVPDPRNI